MINEQIILWICSHQHIYFQAPNQLPFKVIQDKNTKDASKMIRTVLIKYFEVIKEIIKKRMCVQFQNIGYFYLKEGKTQNVPQFMPHPSLRKLIAYSQSQNCKINNIYNSQTIFKEVASFFNIEEVAVKNIVTQFSKAVTDLVKSSKNIDIDGLFFKLIMSKDKIACSFKMSFIKQLNGKIQRDKRTQLIDNLYGWKKQSGEYSKQNRQLNKHWQQIKEGNIFDRPSLKQIKHHLNRGMELDQRYIEMQQKLMQLNGRRLEQVND